MDLLSLVITLTPATEAQPEGHAPAWWGRAGQALLLEVVREADATLAQALHDEINLRPYTASSLVGKFARGEPLPGQSYQLRFTSLTSQLSELLLAAAESGPLAPGRIIELDYTRFQVSAVATTPSAGRLGSWAFATTYSELSSPLLLARDTAPRRLSLELASPTAFKQAGKHVPLPLPDLAFGSLLERWNAFAPVAFPPELRRYAAECLAISRYKLASRAVPIKDGGLRVGAVGQVTYTTINYDRYWMSLVGVLAAFALFAGVGAGTSQGMGQCRQAALE
jgi:CRISPR-associated endoribonuclease Cas6